LPENVRAGETAVLPTFGWGNGLTLLRGLCISLVAGFLLSSWPAGWLGWLPAILYTIADVADYLDGYAARITHQATRLGERLDMEFDGLGTLLVTLLAVWYAQLPWWYLLIGLARYFFVAGLWLRHRFNLPTYPMPHSWHRRIFAGFQMGFMSVVLWPIVPAAGATIAGTMFALATSASFLRDWLLVIGWIEPASDVYIRWQRRVYWLTAVLLPPCFRFILLICLTTLYINLNLELWVALFTSWHLPWPTVIATFWAVVGIIAGIMVVVGAIGRLMALVLMFPLGFGMLASGADIWNGTAVACAIAIMLLGTGAFSLWQPEERFMYRRAGEDEQVTR
jgi:CDP-diacylglycerol--glycerol-3-phosphate 3-phosphatidyltransferase